MKSAWTATRRRDGDAHDRRHRRDARGGTVNAAVAARLAEAAAFVRAWYGKDRPFPELGIVLGSGLAGVADGIPETSSPALRERPAGS